MPLIITNPGTLLLPVDQIYAEGESKARNLRMQKMLRMIGFGENIGSGFPIILDAWSEKLWMKPELIEQRQLMQVKLVLHLVKQNDEPININPLTARQKKLLLARLKREISWLSDQHLIERIGSNKLGYWKVKGQDRKQQ